MKKLLTCALVLALPLAVSCKKGAEKTAADDAMKRYHVEKGSIEYKLTGSQTGTETLYFTDWGMREAKYSTRDFQGVKSNRLDLLNGDWAYSIDLDEKTGTKLANPLLKELFKEKMHKDFAEMGKEMMEAMGGKIVGQKTVAGKQCDLWEIEQLGSTTCLWNWIVLESQVKMGNIEIHAVATKISEGSDIPDDKFALPDGVKLTELNLPEPPQQEAPEAKKQ